MFRISTVFFIYITGVAPKRLFASKPYHDSRILVFELYKLASYRIGKAKGSEVFDSSESKFSAFVYLLRSLELSF